MDIASRIKRLEDFKDCLGAWEMRPSQELRSEISQNVAWVRREILEAGCFLTLTVGPPPAVGGLLMQNVDPFTAIFSPPYGRSVVPIVTDMIDQTIGVLNDPTYEDRRARNAATLASAEEAKMVQKGYVFIAMPINPADAALEDVLDAIKEAADRCGLHAERVDEVQSSERITDRILESIRKAEFVVADLTGSRPNVFYEAGYAQGIQKIPIYIAREGTHLEFDLKDYPIIFFRGMRDLKEGLEKRLRALAEARSN